MDRRGVQRLCLPYHCHFFLARFARQYYIIILHINILPKVNSHPFLYFPYPNYEKNLTFHLLLYERPFSY